MVDAGGSGSVRKCPGAALADFGDVEGFNRSGEEEKLYAFQLSDGVYKRKKFTPSEGIRSLKLEELSDVDISHAVQRRLYSLAFTGDKWVAFADPVQQTGWFIDLKIASLYVVTGKEHKLRKVVNSDKRGSLKMVSESPPPPAGIIGLGLPVSTILLEIVLGDGPDDFVDVLPGCKLKWPQKYANHGVRNSIILKETPQVLFTLADIQGEAEP